MSWYLQKNDGKTLGPLKFDELLRWAAEGRIAPQDKVSQDKKNWEAAEKALKDLKAPAAMNNAQAKEEGNGADPEAGKTIKELEEALEQSREGHRKATERAKELDRKLAELSQGGSDSKISLTTANPEIGRPDELKELSLQNVQMSKEISRLKTMYEEERRGGQELERKMSSQVEEAKRSEADALVQQEDTAKRLHHMELNYKKLTDFAEGNSSEDKLKAQFALLITSHNELSQSYDTLFSQLRQKTQDIDRLMEERSQIKNEATERIQAMEAITKREQDEAARMRQQFVRMEETHLQLVKSYREMNDRIIQYRHSKTPDEPPRQPAGESDKPATGGPRIRLN